MVASFAKVVRLLLLSQVMARKFKNRSMPSQVEQDDPAEYSASEAREKILAALANVHGSMAEGQMRGLDKDEDGALSLAEFVDYLELDFKKDFYTADTDHDGKISVAELEDHNNGGGVSVVAPRQVNYLNSSGVAALHSSEATIVNSNEAAELDDSNAGVRAWWRDLCKSMYPRRFFRFLIRRKCYYRFRRVQFSCWRRRPSAKPKCFMDQMRISNKIHKKCRRNRNMPRYRRCFGKYR